jgi:hypothetical protein
LSVVAAGGTGKSTTLLQLADCMLAEDGPVPLLVPLGEWSDRPDDFFDFIVRRNSFGTFRRQHLMQLAYHGQVVLMLDGWNELTPEARLRATRDVKALQRDYQQLGLVISTRRQALPVAGPVIAIEALSHDQQMELASALRGQDGVGLVDRAWRTPGVRDLVGIPLYLNALLTLPPGAPFPETKEAVLRMFVQQHEATPDKVEVLKRDTLGRQTTMLVGLAVEANRAANTVMSKLASRRRPAPKAVRETWQSLQRRSARGRGARRSRRRVFTFGRNHRGGGPVEMAAAELGNWRSRIKAARSRARAAFLLLGAARLRAMPGQQQPSGLSLVGGRRVTAEAAMRISSSRYSMSASRR